MTSRPDDEPLLRVAGLHKRFGRVVTASDVSFEVGAGRALGIVGPNGAGKSSLLNLVHGSLSPDAGTIVLDGRDVTRLGSDVRGRLGVGRSHQIPRPFEGMTVFENVLVGARFAGGLRRQAAADRAFEALETTGLHRLADQSAGGLRLLDRKRLELARALATGPRVILLDEIAGGLTERELPELIEIITGLRASGLAVVWIEHIVHALVSVVDELLCLAAGEVVAIGEPTAVMADARVVEVYLGSGVEAAS